MNKKLSVIALTLILTLAAPLTIYGLNKPSDLLTYTVQVNASDGGRLYWDYGKNMEFFLCNGDDSYNQNCLIKKDVYYKFSKLIDRAVIPKPDKGYYFDGFHDRFGSKISISPVKVDVIRITKKGLYYYDYVKSLENACYSNYTKKKYTDMVKSFLKSTYGVSRYKVLFQTNLYPLPKKDSELFTTFRAKTAPILNAEKSIEKLYGDQPFYAAPKIAPASGLSYKSSSPKTLSVNKTSGLASIKGEGVVTVTVSVPETDTRLAAKETIKVKIKPIQIVLTSASQKAKGKISLVWKADSKCSGYEAQISPYSDFSKNTVGKSINASKSTQTQIKASSKALCKFARVRAYKKSCGVKLYGHWSNTVRIR